MTAWCNHHVQPPQVGSLHTLLFLCDGRRSAASRAGGVLSGGYTCSVLESDAGLGALAACLQPSLLGSENGAATFLIWQPSLYGVWDVLSDQQATL